MYRVAARMLLTLSAPHRPLSVVTRIITARFPSRLTRNGCLYSVARSPAVCRTSSIFSAYRPRSSPAASRGLRAREPRRGDHLHGLGDLLRVLDAVDPADDVPVCRQLLRCLLSRRRFRLGGGFPLPLLCGRLGRGACLGSGFRRRVRHLAVALDPELVVEGRGRRLQPLEQAVVKSFLLLD